VNVLADRHHSGLYHSLQLMAKRFGWTLYTPTGHDWWDRWYWSFGRGTYQDDRLARQFLMDTNPDGEFPDWPINRVGLEEALGMDWAYVIASVPDNEAGFHKFAKLVGAQYVVQIGNTGQYVDWSRDPLALSSSEMPLEGRGVRYHQEMDPIEFEPVSNDLSRREAASFVNCMPQMGPCWDTLAVAREALGVNEINEPRLAVYGIDGPQGVVKPYSTMLDTMACYGWGWHDKAQGDGFGHVLHTWAAVGRPLVGHASHYRGKMGEVFWRDMETCIDLDRHSVEEACEIVRSISSSDHEQMCLAIRAEFDTIDYEAEAREISDLLGIAVPA
jgi:hypothetical protein